MAIDLVPVPRSSSPDATIGGEQQALKTKRLMDKPPPTRPAPAQSKEGKTARDARLEREAAALRANLHKRKQQARERDKPKPD
jgi:hypothetical protein